MSNELEAPEPRAVLERREGFLVDRVDDLKMQVGRWEVAHAAATRRIVAYRDELEAARAEIARLKTWDGLMSILDELYPVSIIPTTDDDDSRDPGPRLISLLRVLDAARVALVDARAAL